MTAPEFQPITHCKLTPGIVLRVADSDGKYLRLTHVFGDCIYAMWVSTPENARYARRPRRLSLHELQRLLDEPASERGRLTLPTALSDAPNSGSDRANSLEATWNLVHPLIEAFNTEANLSRRRFTMLIRERAHATQTRFITLLRMVLRYYYFGGTRLALLALPRGSRPGVPAYSGAAAPKRRGRQPALAAELGTNDFVVGDYDVVDMANCLESSLRKGPTSITHAHENYLAGPFRRRHPDIHADYIGGKRLEPVTLRQFRYYLSCFTGLDEELARNLRTREPIVGYVGSVRAAGPGEVYEIDSTGGRFKLVSTDAEPVLLGTPTIYLLIDRWSRFIVSVYLSLRAPSYEEVRHTLLIAFTSRVSRFRTLGVDIDDERWPVGRIPAVICPDRGSDFMNSSMEQATVQDLRIELTPLPPLCPDGKAIVERFIREIKRRMAATWMKGVYADRPLDPRSRRAARKAEDAAVHSLSEAYRMLIEIVDDHNNRPHSTLRRYRVLTSAGVSPTPKCAYLWGIESISGLRTAPFTEHDYRRLLLSTDSASIANGVVRYRNRPYLPVNEAAFDLAANSTGRRKAISVRVDRTDPQEVYIAQSNRDWALFRLSAGCTSELGCMSLDEEEASQSRTARLWDRADHQSRVKRVAAKSSPKRLSIKSRGPAKRVGRQEQLRIRQNETDVLKRQLTGKPPRKRVDVTTDESPPAADWMRIQEEERLHQLQLVRKHRRKV